MSYDFDDWTQQDYDYDAARRRARVARHADGMRLVYIGPSRKRRRSRAKRKADVARSRAFYRTFLAEHELFGHGRR